MRSWEFSPLSEGMWCERGLRSSPPRGKVLQDGCSSRNSLGAKIVCPVVGAGVRSLTLKIREPSADACLAGVPKGIPAKCGSSGVCFRYLFNPTFSEFSVQSLVNKSALLKAVPLS